MRSLRSLLFLFAALVPARAFAVGGPAPGAVSAQTVKLPAGPGSVRGLADAATVSGFTGQVQYAVPIDLPAGPGGLTPSLSIGYDGGLGNGPLGIGWSLAQPGIRRSLRLGVPKYDATDEIELVGLGSGQVVALASGELRIEGAGNALNGRLLNGGYELTDADGRVYRFGTTASARKASGTMVSTWYLEEIRDVAGNSIAYRYVADKGEVYLDAIEWGPTVSGARAFRAALEYDARTDAVVSYRTGFRVESGKGLARVKMFSFGAVQRVVELAYDTHFALPRIASVRVTSADGTQALPETKFSYMQTVPGTQTQVPGLTGWALNAQGTSLFDVDNDGAVDLLRLTLSGHSFRRNTGGAFAAPAPVPGAGGASLDKVRLVDLDGDSAAEMLLQQGSQWVVHKLDRASATWISVGPLSGSSNLTLGSVAIADINGDQRMDVLSAFGSQIQVRMGTASGLGPAVTMPPIDSDSTRLAIKPGNASTSFYDFNGDGLADAIYQSSAAFFLYLGKGDGTFERYIDAPFPWTGAVPASQVRLGDLNRDGLLDAVLVSGGNVALYRGRANGTLETSATTVTRPAGTDATVVVALADTNGNGSEDIVWSSDAGMWILDLAGPTTAGMLREVDNGLGTVQRFGYEASTSLMFAAETAGSAWTRTMPTSVPVAVSSRLTLASGEPTRSSRLDVRDAIYDPSERRFIGFEISTVTRPDPADGAPAASMIRTITRYAPGLGIDRVLRGQVIFARIEDGTGAAFTETTHDVASIAVADLPAGDPRLRRAIVRSTEVKHHEGATTPLVTRVENTVDAEGRVIETRDLGRLDLTGDESTTRTRYTAGRSAKGVRDRVCETSLVAPAASGETLVSQARILFGDDQTIAPLCDAGAGWPRETRQFLASEARWVTMIQTRYAASGVPTQSTSGGVTRDLTYDAAGFRPVSETVHPATGESLQWQMAWNNVQQVPSRVVDADGTAMIATHDGLGRPVATARDGAAPHVRHVYHTVAPRPYIETFTFDGAIDGVPAAAEPWTPTARWRHTVEVLNSAGEPMFSATRVDAARWLVSGRRTRDAIGRTVAISEAFEWSGTLADLVASAQPAGTPMRTVTYDALDRPTAQTLADGTQRTTTYRAFQATAITDGIAPVTTELDGKGRIRRTERTVGDVVEAVDATYDAAGRITAMRLPTASGAVTHAFTYDTLGRLTAANDPDIGARTLGYDDAGRLIAATNGADQTTAYAYDGAGRVASVLADDGSQFVYHYDQPRTQGPFQHTAGRLAWVEEPTGTVEHGYDAFGQLHQARRTVHGRISDQITTLGASGLVLGLDDGDGFTVAMSYDAAGRPTSVGELWALEAQDAAGRVLRERFGNGIVQRYERDVLGQPARVRIDRGTTAIYDAAVTRNAFGAITQVTDQDGVGLDHTASFGYDAAARLTSAIIGRAPSAYQFSYRYDGLQNMIGRDVTGPTALSILAGEYRYGEPGAGGTARGPRQLTSVAPPSGPATTLDYDAAGRVVRQGTRALTYNDFDQLTAVSGVPGGTVRYGYGHDGLRVSTVAPGGEETIRFSPAITEHADGTREIDVRLGDRLIARVTRQPSGGGVAAAGVTDGDRRGIAIGVLGNGLLLLAGGLLLRASRRRRSAPLTAALPARIKHRAALAALVPAVGCAAALGCGSGILSGESQTEQHALRTTARTVYYHASFAAGANVITRDDGSVLDERRYEPFGAAIGAIDFARDPHNLLNKETDVHTGWSDHGARWMAPETARWLTPDPPVKAPDPAFMARPWALHPYQYAEQNPIVFWDPDGREPAELPNCPAPRPTNMLLDAAQRIPRHGEIASEHESTLHEVHTGAALSHIVVGIIEAGEKVVDNKVVTGVAHVGGATVKTGSILFATYHFLGWLDSEPGTEENHEHVGGMFSNTLAAALPPVPAAMLALAEILIPDFNKQLGRPILQGDIAHAVAPQREAQARLERGIDQMSVTLNAIIQANPPPISCAMPEPPVLGPPAPRMYGPPAPEPVSRPDPLDQ